MCISTTGPPQHHGTCFTFGRGGANSRTPQSQAPETFRPSPPILHPDFAFAPEPQGLRDTLVAPLGTRGTPEALTKDGRAPVGPSLNSRTNNPTHLCGVC